MAEENNNINIELDFSQQQLLRREKLINMVNEGKNPFEATRFDKTALAGQILQNVSEFENKTVAVSGRIMSKRIMGKAAFTHILDSSGQIQLYIKVDNIGADSYNEYKKLDIGDIIGVSGEIFITHKGEVSINVKSIELLAKALSPLPEKWHGLKDNDLRYRQRYLDLIANPEVKTTFLARSKIIKAIRDYLESEGFVEVETPILTQSATGAAARPFKTHHNTLDLDLHLRIAPELYLKRLIVGGFEKVYELGRMFRNEGMSIKHNPEFTMMELYQAYADYTDMMTLTENIYCAALKALGKGDIINYQGTELNFTRPWKRLTMRDAVKNVTGIDFWELDDTEAREACKKLNIEVNAKNTRGQCLYEIFDKLVEHTLIQPVFITDYPIEVSPLAKRRNDDHDLTYRFEFFVNGFEGGNAYSELNDAIDQRERFDQQLSAKAAGNEEAQEGDDDFITALEYGMPPTGGLGIGIDRMIMLLTDNSSIRDVLLFPTMKPRK